MTVAPPRSEAAILRPVEMGLVTTSFVQSRLVRATDNAMDYRGLFVLVTVIVTAMTSSAMDPATRDPPKQDSSHVVLQ